MLAPTTSVAAAAPWKGRAPAMTRACGSHPGTHERLRQARRALAVHCSREKQDAPIYEWVAKNLKSEVAKSRSMGGSSWASMQQLELEDGRKLFVKSSQSRDPESMFAGEYEGLKAMYETGTVKIPQVFHYGALAERGSFIVMENMNFGGRVNQAQFGEKLALMHLAEPSQPEAKQGLFGFKVDNTIGGTPQPNDWTEDWVEFYREKRIRHQCQLSGDKTLMDLGDKLCERMGDFFEGVEIKPSILHGDLWVRRRMMVDRSGNVAAWDDQPAIYDPACYYGHHEAEFGMQWCASFNGEFWAAYHNLIPKADGFEARKQLYLLYHYLNHYNLFGGGYYGSAAGILRGLVAL